MNLYADPSRPCPEGWTLARTPNEALAILAKGGVQRMAIGIDGPDAKAWRRLVPRMARAGTWPTERPSVHGSDARSVDVARCNLAAYYLAKSMRAR